MRNKTERPKRDRRAFIKGAAAVGGVTAVAVAGGAAVANVSPDETPQAQAKASPEKKGYRETEHVRKYYRSAQL